MTVREKAIVTAYTGVVMCVGDELGAFYEYVESLGFTGLYSHHFASRKLWDEIKARSKPDFLALCARTDPPTEISSGNV